MTEVKEFEQALPQTEKARPLWGAALCYCAVSWLMVGFSWWMGSTDFRISGMTGFAILTIAPTILIILVPALIYLGITRGFKRALSPIRVRDGLSALGMAIFGLLPTLFVNALWQALLMAFGIPVSPLVLPMAEGAGDAMFLALAIAVVPGLCEEFMFRGVLLEGLARSMSMKKALFLSAALFGIAHMNLPQAFPTAVLGLVIGYLYLKTRSIWPSILYHTLHNALTVLLYQGVIKLAETAQQFTQAATEMAQSPEFAQGMEMGTQLAEQMTGPWVMLIGAAVMLIPAGISFAIFFLLARGFSRREPLVPAPAFEKRPMGTAAGVLLALGALAPVLFIIVNWGAA